jgi:sugar/nucleoside kinase (ribokinase family)
LSWNPGKKELQLLAEKKLTVSSVMCDILIMNEEEWELVKEVHAQLLEHIPFIVITNGRKGGDLYIRGRYEHHYDIQSVAAVQETGAGDAFTVGFVSAHLLGRPPAECCTWGVKNAASVIQHMDAKTGLLQRRDFGLPQLTHTSISHSIGEWPEP